MKQTTDALVRAPTDLINFLNCRHPSTLDFGVARGEVERPEPCRAAPASAKATTPSRLSVSSFRFPPFAACHYPCGDGTSFPEKGVVTGGKSAFQASGGKGFAKRFPSEAPPQTDSKRSVVP